MQVVERSCHFVKEALVEAVVDSVDSIVETKAVGGGVVDVERLEVEGLEQVWAIGVRSVSWVFGAQEETVDSEEAVSAALRSVIVESYTFLHSVTLALSAYPPCRSALLRHTEELCLKN